MLNPLIRPNEDYGENDTLDYFRRDYTLNKDIINALHEGTFDSLDDVYKEYLCSCLEFVSTQAKEAVDEIGNTGRFTNNMNKILALYVAHLLMDVSEMYIQNETQRLN